VTQGAVSGLQIHDELPSTSDACIAAAKAGAPDGLALLARRQTAGRGSHGRSWASLPGNLSLSVLIRGPIPAASAGHWSLLAGLATLRALAPYAPPDSLQLKWPNDVNLHGAKLAGILIDSAAGPDATLDWLVIGIGANLAQAPHLAGRPTACLASAPPPEVVAAALLTHIMALRSTLEQDGHGAIRAAWLAHAHPLGTTLLAGGRRGRFAGLSPSGSLLLDDGAIHTIGAGDIMIAPASTPSGTSPLHTLIQT
jgi:BirA family biotin operon repressor/biotin-[acetyl-CoA-carboxylase] ligase